MKPEPSAAATSTTAPTSAVNAVGQESSATISVQQVQQHIHSTILADERQPATILQTAHQETLPLQQALGRVLAQDLISPLDVPPHDNSAMDGYALRSADLQQAAQTSLLQLRIIATALAGASGLAHGNQNSDVNNTCVRIMTGAVMPAGYDTVIPQELVHTITTECISIDPHTVKPGANRRLRGEDLRQGHTILHQGRLLQPADLGLFASLGIPAVTVQRRLRVALISTGDELTLPGTPLAAGHIYDSNRYTLHAMLQRLNCEVLDMGIIQDQPAALSAVFRQAIQHADVVITSGGVSAGIADYTKQIMAELGQICFWNIDMRPGRPLAFGKIHSDQHSAYLFGLPGNPVAVMVAFYFFVREALLQLMQATITPVPLLPAITTQAIPKRAGRTEYQRGIVNRTAYGTLAVTPTNAQGSGILRSMSEANCIIVLPAETTNVAAGENVDVILFEGLCG